MRWLEKRRNIRRLKKMYRRAQECEHTAYEVLDNARHDFKEGKASNEWVNFCSDKYQAQVRETDEIRRDIRKAKRT